MKFPGNAEKVYFCISMKTANDCVPLAGKVTARVEEACSGEHLLAACHSLPGQGVIWAWGSCPVFPSNAPRLCFPLDSPSLGPRGPLGVPATLSRGAKDSKSPNLDLGF